MSNIYIIIENLENHKNSPDFTYKQKMFIKLLLEGIKDQWRPLRNLAETPSHVEIKNIISSIEEELKNNNSNFSDKVFYSTYTKLLYKCLSNFRGMDTHMNLVSQLVSENKFKKFANIYDDIYQKTIDKYNGSIVLPICQGLDSRLGDSKGECHGYFCHWATSILENKNPFGININDTVSFKPIQFNSTIGKKLIEWNHLAILNKNISHYQRNQPDKVKSELRNVNKFYLSTYTISRKLLTAVTKQPGKVYELQIFGGTFGLTGHSLGFCKRGDQFHFFDSNSMWVSFKRPADFELWLSYYFESIGYDKIYNEYCVISYESSNEVELELKKKLQILLLGEGSSSKSNIEITATAITFSLLTPIMCSYFFIARPIIHAVLNVGKQCKSILNYFNHGIEERKFIIDLSIPIKQSMDDIDTLKKASKKVIFLDSTHSVATMLDIDVQKVQKAKKTLIENNNNIKFFKSKHLPNYNDTNPDELSSSNLNLSKLIINNYF